MTPIASETINWYHPAQHPPPFDKKLLVMMAGTQTNDAGRTWQPYTQVITASIQKTGPGDEYDDTTALEDFLAGDKTDFLDYQFDMTDGEGNEIEDWWSDSIIAWAHYPAEPARVALETEKKRQAAA